MTKQGWPLVGDARREMADLVEGLSAEQLAAPSVCGGWSNHQVAAHLLTFTHVGVPSRRFFSAMLRSRFDYDTAADRLASELATEHSGSEIATMLRDEAEHENRFKAFPPEMTLTDVTVHLQDIRRALGIEGGPSPHVVDTVLVWMTTHKQAKAVVGDGLLEGLQFATTDTDWSFGTGPLVEGPGEALIMALAGRDSHDELRGDGAAEFRQRCGH